MILNITHMGQSVDYALGAVVLDDDDVRRVAVELAHVEPSTFEHYVIDRLMHPNGEEWVLVRPKVPFGSGE